MKLTKEELEKFFYYDAGNICNKVQRGKSLPGKIIGTINGMGYLIARINGTAYRVHRLIWILLNGEIKKGFEIDHIDGIKTNNKIENLRVVPHDENMRNTRKCSRNTSGHVGVSWRKRVGKWQVQIKSGGVSKHLGYFINKEDAIKARQEANIKYGFHPGHGKVLQES